MPYEGSIELLSGIKQKNNGTFPLVDASAVRVDDSHRLDDILEKTADGLEIEDGVISLTNNGATLDGASADLPSYGLSYNTATGGLSLTENGTPITGQTVALPPYGSPLKAATVAGMTDTDSVYVYTGSETGYTAGHWYYHDGSGWVDGGVYNAVSFVTDTTLAVSGQAADAKVTGDQVTDLKKAFEKENDQFKIPLINGQVISLDGTIYNNAQYVRTDYIPCDSNTIVVLHDFWTGDSSLAYSFYTDNNASSFISGQSNVIGNVDNITIPANAKYIAFSSRTTDGWSGTWNPEAYVYNHHAIIANIELLNEDSADHESDISDLQNDVSEINGKISAITPANTTFFDIYDFIDNAFIDFWGVFVATDGYIWANSETMSIKLKVEPNTTYVLEIPGANRATGTSNTNGVFETGHVYTTLSLGRNDDLITFTTSSNIYYAVIYFYSGTYDTSHGTEGIHLYKDIKKTDITPTVKLENLPLDKIDTPYEIDVLVFGDSITDTTNITIDAETDCTTAYSVKTPNNSYVKNGVTIQYAMWPTLIQRVLNIRELRNYALSGAHFYTTSNPPSNPREKLLYQVQVALNDLSNPNNVFPNDDFYPDIIIVACGINDGNIAEGSFETTMNKTVMNQAGTGVDVEATMTALNQQNPEDAARYVFMLLKQTFPESLFLYVNPLQQTYGTNAERLTAREELRKMAEQYDFVNLDGFGQFGVVRDFETREQIGLLTKDGLHPNEKGQNLYARNIVQAIKRYYLPLNKFNSMS